MSLSGTGLHHVLGFVREIEGLRRLRVGTGFVDAIDASETLVSPFVIVDVVELIGGGGGVDDEDDVVDCNVAFARRSSGCRQRVDAVERIANIAIAVSESLTKIKIKSGFEKVYTLRSFCRS